MYTMMMNGVLGHFCAHVRLNGAERPPGRNEMKVEMKHTPEQDPGSNPGPVGLKPRSLPLAAPLGKYTIPALKHSCHDLYRLSLSTFKFWIGTVQIQVVLSGKYWNYIRFNFVLGLSYLGCSQILDTPFLMYPLLVVIIWLVTLYKIINSLIQQKISLLY